MDRVFLDANVLFSASYRPWNGLLRLWQLADTELVTSSYALNEAHRNLTEDSQQTRLNDLAVTIVAPTWTADSVPESLLVPEKDLPILLDAIHSRSTHLLTGDKRHFGSLFGQLIGGVHILPPAEYLALRLVRDQSDSKEEQE